MCEHLKLNRSLRNRSAVADYKNVHIPTFLQLYYNNSIHRETRNMLFVNRKRTPSKTNPRRIITVKASRLSYTRFVLLHQEPFCVASSARLGIELQFLCPNGHGI